MKNQTVESIIQQERKNIQFDVKTLSQFLYGKQEFTRLCQLFDKNIIVPYDFNDFNKGRVELIKESFRTLPIYLNSLTNIDNAEVLYQQLATFHQMPGTVHITMFSKVIEIMGAKSQKQQYLSKCKNFTMVGCYAQTELGHGSDVQSIQTTATYVMGKDQFIINTPTITAAKYWPGQLGIFCTHAMVYAQMIVKGKNHGVNAFIVRIRDQNHKVLPGIQCGDIGPKIGFHSKDNGFLILNNVTIPKSNMLRGFVSVSKKGQIKKKGDPKVSYATMMKIRQHISCVFPKIYSQGITIGLRYNLFRKQFTDQKEQQQNILVYQTQQDKIITRIAEYYTMTSTGNSIKQITEDNFQLVTEKNNFDLMNETHVCLCIGKAHFSELIVHGLETLRKSCGGHGYSHYSGLPILISQYMPNLTLQGQNTVLYLQITRYILKNYKWFLTKKKKLADSMAYIENIDHIMDSPLDQSKRSFDQFCSQDIQKLMMQSVFSLIRRITNKMMSKQQGKPDLDVWNFQAGVQIGQLGLAHSVYYTFKSFSIDVERQNDLVLKKILKNLNNLYGVQMFLNFSNQAMIQGLIKPYQITALKQWKQVLLRQLRPSIVGLVDAFAIPQHLIRSALARTNPYQNFLELARKNHLNHKVQQSGILVKDKIKQALGMHPVAKL